MASKLERLLNLTAVLLDTNRPLSADDLRQLVEGYPPPGPAFHRAFERDKDDLRAMGIPLAVERIPATDPPLDGYRIRPEEYYLADPGLSADELAALHLATLAVTVEGAAAGPEALWKLGGVHPLGAAGPSVATVAVDAAVTPLFGAIGRRRPVRFAYQGVTRTVDPWRLHFQRGRWYLSGFDHVRQAERNYRIARIEGEVEELTDTAWSTDPPARRPRGRALAGWELGDGEPTLVELLVDAERVDHVRGELGPTATERPHPRGSVFTVAVTNQEAFRSLVAGLLEHGEVLSPPSVRAAFIDWLRTIAATGSEQ